MAKRVNKPPEEITVEQEPTPDTELTAIMNAMDEAASDSTARVFREGAGGHRDLAFLFSCLPSEWMQGGLERLQRDYGSGKYRVHLQNSERQMVLNRSFSVEALPKKPGEEIVKAPTDALTAILQRMEDNNRVLLEALRGQRPDSMAGIKEMVGLVKEMIPQHAAPVVASTGLQIADVLGIMKMVQDMSPKGDTGGDPGNHVMNRGIDLVASMFERMGQQPPPMQRPVLRQQAPSPVAASVQQQPQPSENPESGDDEMGIMEQMAKLELRRANAKAKANDSAEEYAEEIYERIPDDVLVDMASNPQWFLSLTGLVPDAAQYQAWHTRVRDKLVAMAGEDGILTKAGPSATVPGNGSDLPTKPGTTS